MLFHEAIAKFNSMYGLPCTETPTTELQGDLVSKLGVDGKPIHDERGKVQKGPGYWKPEPKLKEMLLQRLSNAS